MATVRTKDNIIACQVGTDGGGDRLFSDVSMTCAVYEAPLVGASEFFFGVPNRDHCPVKLEQCVAIDGCG